MAHNFVPLTARMRYIARWGLMRNTQPENIQEHSHQVAVLAHALAVIQNQYFGGSVDPGRVAVAALYHDASEILTGDLPTPIKYDNPDIQSAYQQVEAVAVEKLLSMLPEELRPAYEEALTIPDPEVRALVKAADKLSAYLKCVEELKAGNLPDFTPTAFLFGAKAAPGYDRAKAIIRYINRIAHLINSDPTMHGKLQVLFVQNYNCSYAEQIIPAADISEQISPAGTEASGTGNMKLMLNGAVTLGTLDGANVEIVQQAGLENNYIFGSTVEELESIRDSYQPRELYDSNPLLRRVVDTLVDGTIKSDAGLAELHTALLDGASWHKADHYFLLKDFTSYLDAKLRANRDYQDRLGFGRKCLKNIAAAGTFSSDRTVRQYAEDIWHI